jgi:hypothetical protein
LAHTLTRSPILKPMLTITSLAALRESPDEGEAMELADEGEAEAVASQGEHEGFFHRLWDGFVNMIADVSEGKEVVLPQGEGAAPPAETRPGSWGTVGAVAGAAVLGFVVVAFGAAARRHGGAQLLPQGPRPDGEYPEAEYVRMEE